MNGSAKDGPQLRNNINTWQAPMRDKHHRYSSNLDAISENLSHERNGHSQNGAPYPPSRSKSASDWGQLDKRFTKLHSNGYKQKELINGVRHLSLSDLDNPISHQDCYHLNEGLNDEAFQKDGHFAGRRNILDPNSLQELEIVSSKGTVRGFRNRVRAGIATFIEQNGRDKRNFKQTEKGKIVIYTTSMSVVRETYDACRAVTNILQTHMVRYEEKDLFMSRENQKELMDRLGGSDITLPQAFADGHHIGGADEVELLNETGELRKILKHFKRVSRQSSCSKCGGFRYAPCEVCHGSKKSLHRNNFTEEFCALRCMNCDENGLVRCDLCLDQQE